jgi:hypothetical protein
MVRFVMATVAVLCLTAAVQAENIRGVVRNVDGKATVTVWVANADRTLVLAPDVKVYSTYTQGRLPRRRQMVTMEVSNGLNSLQPNTQILCTTEMRDGQEVVTQIRLEGMVAAPLRR